MIDISLSQQMEEVRHAIEQVYPLLISKAGYRRASAEYHVRRMRGVLDTLERVKEHLARVAEKEARGAPLAS